MFIHLVLDMLVENGMCIFPTSVLIKLFWDVALDLCAFNFAYVCACTWTF